MMRKKSHEGSRDRRQCRFYFPDELEKDDQSHKKQNNKLNEPNEVRGLWITQRRRRPPFS